MIREADSMLPVEAGAAFQPTRSACSCTAGCGYFHVVGDAATAPIVVVGFMVILATALTAVAVDPALVISPPL